MLADMNLNELDARAEAWSASQPLTQAKNMVRERLAAHARKNDKLNQTEVVHCSHLGEQRIVRSHQRLVIEGLLEPPPYGFRLPKSMTQLRASRSSASNSRCTASA